MEAPIYDFLRDYAARDVLRLHMPGHKGCGALGCEGLDLTEIPGADSIYEASGIIAKSEENAAALFGCPTFYSCEGASLALRAMVYLALRQAWSAGRRPVIAAARNVHKSFVYTAVLLDAEILWIGGEGEESHLSCHLTPEAVARALDAAPDMPAALYLTSPDYLGHMADVAALAEVCHRRDVLVLVDCAHGAYLKFLRPSLHPMDLGADLSCASAHKTLPVLTGGAYLHVAARHPALVREAKAAMALFGSTSPSYLILASLDLANQTLAGAFPGQLEAAAGTAAALRARLAQAGFRPYGDEPMKLTLRPKALGYTGTALCEALARQDILCEFADEDFLVMMLAPDTDCARLERALLSLPRRAAISGGPPPLPLPPRRLSLRRALFAPLYTVAVGRAESRGLADVQVSCPPAVPIVVLGEEITPQAAAAFSYYGVTSVAVCRTE